MIKLPRRVLASTIATALFPAVAATAAPPAKERCAHRPDEVKVQEIAPARQARLHHA